MFNQTWCNIESHSYESSIIQTCFCTLQNSSMGDGVLQNISYHVASLSWSYLPLWCAQPAKSLTSKSLNNHALWVTIHILVSTWMNLWASLFYYKYALEYYSNIIIESKHTCIEFGCICGLTLVGKYSNFVGNVWRSYVETNQG